MSRSYTISALIQPAQKVSSQAAIAMLDKQTPTLDAPAYAASGGSKKRPKSATGFCELNVGDLSSPVYTVYAAASVDL